MFIKKEWMLTTAGVFTVSVLLTIIVAFESKWMPLAPYFPIYAALAILIPWKLGIWRPEWDMKIAGKDIKHTFAKHWKIILAIFVIAGIWNIESEYILYNILACIELTGISFDAAINLVAQEAAIKFGFSTIAAMGIYAFFIVLWAPIGESLFYLRYIQGTLRQENSFAFSAFVSMAFFSIRHATHFLFLLPEYPIAAGLIWVLSAFVFGFLMSYLYEKTNSLYPPAIIHFIVNIASIVLCA